MTKGSPIKICTHLPQCLAISDIIQGQKSNCLATAKSALSTIIEGDGVDFMDVPTLLIMGISEGRHQDGNSLLDCKFHWYQHVQLIDQSYPQDIETEANQCMSPDRFLTWIALIYGFIFKLLDSMVHQPMGLSWPKLITNIKKYKFMFIIKFFIIIIQFNWIFLCNINLF